MDPVSEIQRQLGNVVRFGTIFEVDCALARCRVRSGENESDFVPWVTTRAGETSDWSPPKPGEQVVLLCPTGDMLGAVALRGIYSDQRPPPANSATLHVVRYADGAQIEYDHGSHALKATLPQGGTAEITADGGITINGPLTVNGETKINGNTSVDGDIGVSGKAEAQADVIGGGISLKDHKHPGVMAGGAITGKPQ
ncbi:phage baseplate assembly protein V [Lysobacter sp. CA199]|uniref:phage baseplate assembly protein V n=1 Tax=Lysobacter sp. CA199 TaxID=3455608 RepID=UPI003F8D4EED